MASSIETPSIRISLIAGRYLIFDPAAASHLRRTQNTCGNLVGTLPQQPVQNVFLGMPIEIRAEEAQALVHRGAAYVVDNVAAHKDALRGGAADRKKYVDGLRKRKEEKSRAVAEQLAEREVKRAQMLAKSKKSKKTKSKDDKQPSPAANDNRDDDGGLFEQPSAKPVASSSSKETLPLDSWAVTPTTSNELLPPESDRDFEVSQIRESPLARFLQGLGYYMTPGLRFGCRYSVYPGDLLRFHAHFMANDYDWDEPIPMLDIVEGGRLATAVKKSFLIGGEDPDHKSPSGDKVIRTYSLEWAGM